MAYTSHGRIHYQCSIGILSLAFLLLTGNMSAQPAVSSEYEASWESLKNYSAPEWYEDAKLGFWVHWGVYSVPAYDGDHAAEWYGRRMYQKDRQSQDNKGYAQHKHHLENYGDPSEFGYKDFIPMFRAENFDADEWADLCVRGGAKFFTMMGSHHDAFCLWDTKLSKWNSVNMGPKRDLVGELEKAVRAKGLRFGVSNHSAWNYMFFQWNHINGCDAVDPETQDLYGNPVFPKEMADAQFIEGESRNEWRSRGRDPLTPSKRDIDRWLARTKELCDMYKPDLYYFDWGFRVPEFEPGRKEFGAHYYNKAVEWQYGCYGAPGVVLNYKGRSYQPGTAVRDFEHGAFDDIHHMVWQTDESIYMGNNWGYAAGESIKPANMIIDQLMDIISKRGVLMLSFAPKADGTFPDDQKALIFALGDWLQVCGEAVYGTRPYEVLGELGENWLEKDEYGHKKYLATTEDIRFTRNKANTVLYATSLEWPGKNLLVKSLAGSDLTGVKSVRLLGVDKELKWKQEAKGMKIKLPKKPGYDYAFPVRIEFEREIASRGSE